MKRHLFKNKYEQGNVLFLILIAVVLFAALSYAVTKTTQGGGGNINEEKLRTGAAGIQQYVADMRAAAQRLMTSNGCTIENLDWRNEHWIRIGGDPSVGILHSPVSPKDGCAIFSSHGGIMSDSVDFEAYGEKTRDTTTTWRVKAGHATMDWVNRKNEGSDANDIAIIFRGMDNRLCSYLLDPVSRPTNIIESYQWQSDPNIADTFTWNTSNDMIDEPENLAGDFFANYNVLSTGGGCDVGAIIVSR